MRDGERIDDFYIRYNLNQIHTCSLVDYLMTPNYKDTTLYTPRKETKTENAEGVKLVNILQINSRTPQIHRPRRKLIHTRLLYFISHFPCECERFEFMVALSGV